LEAGEESREEDGDLVEGDKREEVVGSAGAGSVSDSKGAVVESGSAL
jgi:hypothetical protein